LPHEAGDEQPWGHNDHSGMMAPVESLEPYQLPAFLTPAGNLSLSLPDYVTFLRLHLTALKGESRLLSREAARQLHGLDGGAPMAWGRATNAEGVLMSQHLGTSGAFLAAAVLYPERDTGFACLANAFGGEVEKAAIHITKAALSSTSDA
jgi:CubicO group peptidase (beta-lactamase class C family)